MKAEARAQQQQAAGAQRSSHNFAAGRLFPSTPAAQHSTAPAGGEGSSSTAHLDVVNYRQGPPQLTRRGFISTYHSAVTWPAHTYPEGYAIPVNDNHKGFMFLVFDIDLRAAITEALRAEELRLRKISGYGEAAIRKDLSQKVIKLMVTALFNGPTMDLREPFTKYLNCILYLLEGGHMELDTRRRSKAYDPMYLMECLRQCPLPIQESLASLVSQEVHPLDADSVLRFLHSISVGAKTGLLAYESNIMECTHWWRSIFPELEKHGKIVLLEAHNDPMLLAQDPVFPGRPFPPAFAQKLHPAMTSLTVTPPVAFRQSTTASSAALLEQFPMLNAPRPATMEECKLRLVEAKQQASAATEAYLAADKSTEELENNATFDWHVRLATVQLFELMLAEFSTLSLDWRLFWYDEPVPRRRIWTKAPERLDEATLLQQYFEDGEMFKRYLMRTYSHQQELPPAPRTTAGELNPLATALTLLQVGSAAGRVIHTPLNLTADDAAVLEIIAHGRDLAGGHMAGDTHVALVVRWLSLVKRQPNLKGLTQANLVERFADVAHPGAGRMLRQALQQDPRLTLYNAVQRADAYMVQHEQKRVTSLPHNLQGLKLTASDMTQFIDRLEAANPKGFATALKQRQSTQAPAQPAATKPPVGLVTLQHAPKPNHLFPELTEEDLPNDLDALRHLL